MSFLGRLFGRDPAALLAQASELLERNDPAQALALARRAERQAKGELGQRAAELAALADGRLLAIAIERVDVADQAELWEEALEYSQVALDRATVPEIRQRLEQRAADFRRRINEQADAEAKAEALALAEKEARGRPVEDVELEAHYHALLDTLDDEVVELWRRLPEAFRPAWVAFNSGEAETAAETLEVLCEQFPSEPALRFERGRCRLLLGHPEGARDDFEAVWEVFGVEPLDHAGTLSIPGLWSEAQLAAGQPQAVLERLAEIQEPRRFDEQLTTVYAGALLSSQQWQEAADYLSHAHQRFPKSQELTRQLAIVLDHLERRPEAIQVLDTTVRACSSGSCGSQKMELASARLLIRLMLDQQGDADRMEELFGRIHLAQGGVWTRADAELLVTYHRQQGNDEAAEETAELLERLKQAEEA